MEVDGLKMVLLTECCLLPAKTVLVGVSGGPDSLCLLDVLVKSGYQVVVAHFDHGLRPESAEEASLVQAVAEGYGKPFLLERLDVGDFASRERLSIEEAARTVRYQFLYHQARLIGAQAVAVAHTADDQVETVLMHLLRGAGLSGLKGMVFRRVMTEWDAVIPLVRPLLGIWRTEILDYCEMHHIQTVFDQSNLDITYFRNRLRHKLIPYLEQYNPRVKEVIWRMSQTLASDHALLMDLVSDAWDRCCVREDEKYVVLSYPEVSQLARGLLCNIIRKAIAHLRPGMRNINFATIERAGDFVCQPSRSGQIDLVSGIRMDIEGEKLFISDEDARILEDDWPQLIPGKEIELPVPGEVYLSGGWHLKSKLISQINLDELFSLMGDANQAWLDAESLSLPLCVRTRQPGDRLQPLGMDGHSLKLSDFLINVRMSRRARDGWPLVYSGESIAWVPSYRPTHPFRLKETTRQVVNLHLVRDSEV